MGLTGLKNAGAQDSSSESKRSAVPGFPVGHLRAFATLVRSEYRVTIFVWSITTAYLLATDLKPNPIQLVEVLIVEYFLSFGIYVYNAVMDVEEDKINHADRPIASGRVSVKDGWLIFGISTLIAIVTSVFINPLCLIISLVSFVLGVAYSHPRIRAKRHFSLKMTVGVLGAVCCSLCGGAIARNIDGPVYFSALFFGLFAMVTLLLGDLSDVPGDMAAGIKSLPIAIGAQNVVVLIACLPLVIASLGVAFFQMLDFNPLFPVLIVGVTVYSSLNIIALLGRNEDYASLKRVKSKMRIVSFAIQLTLILGLLAL